MIRGTVDTTPLYDNLKGLIADKFPATSGTIRSSAKNTITTAMHRYIEQSTPNKLENLSALAFLGIDIGNRIQ
jgi:hypothetical protein